MFFQLSQWMKEKHKTATDESYRDLANLNEKLKKHEAFELELKANNARLNQLNGVCCSFRNTFKFIFSEKCNRIYIYGFCPKIANLSVYHCI